MSVIVKGMEMPKNCGECPFIFSSWGIKYYCHLAESSTSAEYVEREKMTNCPLIELPPHGRLIDADKLKSRLVLDNDSNELQRISADILKWIDIQETVIKRSET